MFSATSSSLSAITNANSSLASETAYLFADQVDSTRTQRPLPPYPDADAIQQTFNAVHFCFSRSGCVERNPAPAASLRQRGRRYDVASFMQLNRL